MERQMRGNKITLGAAVLRNSAEARGISERAAVHRLAETMAGYAREKTVFGGTISETMVISLKARDEDRNCWQEYAATTMDVITQPGEDAKLNCVRYLAEQMHRDGLLTVKQGAKMMYTQCWNAQVTLKIEKEDDHEGNGQDEEVADP